MHFGHEPDPAPLRAGAGNGLSPRVADAERVRDLFALDRRSDLWTGLARLGGVLPAPGHADADPWALLRGWKHPPRSRGADGRLVGAAGQPGGDARPRFDAAVPPGGYGWWYVDAISQCGRHGLTIIAFIGSVFSPYYKKSGRGDPLDHCALNVALYVFCGRRWGLTGIAIANVLTLLIGAVQGPVETHLRLREARAPAGFA